MASAYPAACRAVGPIPDPASRACVSSTIPPENIALARLSIRSRSSRRGRSSTSSCDAKTGCGTGRKAAESGRPEVSATSSARAIRLRSWA